MPYIRCLICNAEFYAKPNHRLKGWGKYCSIPCRSKSQFKGKSVYCSTCNKTIYKSPKDLRTSKSKKYFCNRSCQTIWRNTTLFSGENHRNWKNGKSAYRRILKTTGIQQICMLCKTKDIRVLAVHHRDRNRNNNTIENLIWLCHNCHYLIHHFTNEEERLNKLMVAVVHK